MEISLVFEPSDLEIIETIDFEEEVQRPEELRFFTLDEQLIDYFQKSLPKKKHITKAENLKIKKEVDRIKELYEDLVVVTDTDYRIDDERREINVPWLKSIYGGFDYEKFSYTSKLLPLAEPAARRMPNAYPIILKSLPRPYRSEGTDGVPITKSTDLVNDEGLEMVRALGNYIKLKRIIRDDGSLEVLKLPEPNTSDDIRRVGFFIEDRKLDIPHPLADHPFLSSAKSNKLMTSEPLKDVFPTIEAILSHAVPVTKDPYVEGHKYLKLYDVKISEVPWKSWKERFPPVDAISAQPNVLSIVFPNPDDIVAPSERLQKVYDSKWNKSVYPRAWLMNQEDGGWLVTKMLLSDAGEFGLIAPDVINERPQIQLPKSTPDECLATKSFEEFLASGVYRSPTYKKKGDDWVEVTSGICAPTAFVTQERQEFINQGKKAWSETTQTNIQKEYISLFKFYQPPKDARKETEYEKYTPKGTSELRENILIILKDNTLLPPDKSYNIRLLTKEITPVNNQFLDSEGLFLICNHTLSLLDGDLEADKSEFYNKWATLDEGYRVCKSCGEQINNDSFVAQDDYDDDGHLVVSHDVIAGDTMVAVKPIASSLSQLKNVFDENNGGESVMYLILNSLQIIPSESQLIPILGNIRKGSLAAKKLQGSARNKFEGLLGIAGTVTLLQIHNPFLVPRRSFGNKVVKLSGFPRDTLDEKDTPALNVLLTILKELVDAFPVSFKEPLATILREVSNNRKKVREECIRFIKQAYTEFRPQFEAAKERAEIVSDTVEVNDVFLPAIFPTKVEFKPGDRQGDEVFSECLLPKPKTVIVSKLLPSVSQKFVDFWKTKPSSHAEYIENRKVTLKYAFPDKKDIEKGVKIGLAKTAKLELIRKFVDSDTDGVALSALLSRLLDIVAPLKYESKKVIEYRQFLDNINSFENKSLFRDAVKGRIYELLDSLKDGVLDAVRLSMTRDLTMNMILLTKEASEKEVDILRSKERETLKARLREMDDRSREVTKMLMDIGISQYVITNEDRRRFAKELNMEVNMSDDTDDPNNTPEGGFTNRDYVDSDEQLNENGLAIEPDRGDYGDVRDRPFDDYSREYSFDNVD
jgi:hypothetical protein